VDVGDEYRMAKAEFLQFVLAEPGGGELARRVSLLYFISM
jgi:hypothetical protein